MVVLDIQCTDIYDRTIGLKIDKYPDTCPYCNRSMIPKFQTAYLINEEGGVLLEIAFTCTRHTCQQMFVAFYFAEKYAVSTYKYDYSSIGEIKKKDFSDIIEDISINFVLIYNESHFAEQFGKKQICGVGYRKSLEFLIKDYAIKLNPGKEEEIKNIPLGACIDKYINEEKIKIVAKRAVWLGNDETHYVKKWEDKDLTDLKKLIDLTIHWIDAEELTKDILKDMPK